MAIKKRGFYSPWGYEEENDYQSSKTQFEIQLDNVLYSAKYNKDDKKIHFYSIDGDELSGSTIDTTEFSNSPIESTSYDKETKILTIKFSNGDVIEINLADLIDENEFGDGLQVDGGIVSVKIDANSEPYISVSDSGISVTGIDNAIDEEKNRAQNSESVLDSKIDNEASRAIEAETALNERIDDVISGSTTQKLNELIEKLGYDDNDTLELTNEREVSFGEYNISHTDVNPSGQTAFSIGIGTDDANRKNAVEVMKNGDVYMWVEGEYMNVNKLLGMLAHEVYDNNSTY